jgi:uncharacterized protein
MSLKKSLTEIHEEVLKMLRDKLPPELSYHTFEHTQDVIKAAERIARSENVNEEDFMLLKTAAVFHDAGYIYSRENHEEESCLLAKQFLSANGYKKEDIDKICDLILATKVPQKPKNKLSEIICDADLDYLGRDDYFPISKSVYTEFRHFGIVNNEQEWKQMQIRFMESHHYFTDTSNMTRNAKKEENLKKIKNGGFSSE